MDLAKNMVNKVFNIIAQLVLCSVCATPVLANVGENVILDQSKIRSFSQIYEHELGSMTICDGSNQRDVSFCYSPLKNAGNAPFILTPANTPRAVVVLFHGLSDSPFFMRSIAEFLQKKGYLVIAPLNPGHGLKDADADMEDENLKTRWTTHVDDVMSFAQVFDLPIVIGGFSTGGALASYYTIKHFEKIEAMLLFSGALELGAAAEAMSKIWGMKYLASIMDGKYETQGPHPYKYPTVASYSGLVLLDVIKDIRELLVDSSVRVPIFAAHSMADNVTLFAGIEYITSEIEGDHTIFKIDESYDVCHADVPMSAVQIINLQFDKSQVDTNERCAVPKANPIHEQMLLMLDTFLDEQFPISNE